MFVQFFYISAARPGFDLAQCRDILASAHRNNPALGVTGLLLFLPGSFAQVLEGPGPAVRALMDRISADPRHRGLRIVLRETAAVRRFPDWPMGFEAVTPDTPRREALIAVARRVLVGGMGPEDLDVLSLLMGRFEQLVARNPAA